MAEARMTPIFRERKQILDESKLIEQLGQDMGYSDTSLVFLL
jgi:hypothetical protein